MKGVLIICRVGLELCATSALLLHSNTMTIQHKESTTPTIALLFSPQQTRGFLRMATVLKRCRLAITRKHPNISHRCRISVSACALTNLVIHVKHNTTDKPKVPNLYLYPRCAANSDSNSGLSKSRIGIAAYSPKPCSFTRGDTTEQESCAENRVSTQLSGVQAASVKDVSCCKPSSCIDL